MSKWSLAAAAFTAGFVPYVFAEPPWDRIYFSAYMVVLIVSFLLPMRRPEVTSRGYASFFRGMLVFLSAVIFPSLFIIPLSIPLNLDASKYVATFWIFFSLIPVVGSAFRLSRLGEVLKEAGVQSLASDRQSRLDHFVLDYSLSLHGFATPTSFYIFSRF